MGLIRKTLSVNFTLGAVGYRSKSEKVERNIKLAAQAAQRTNVLLSVQNDLLAEQTKHIECQCVPLVSNPAPVPAKKTPSPAKPVMVKAPPREPKIKVPKPVKLSVENAVIDKAEKLVISTQSSSRFELMTALDVSGDECNLIMKALEKRGVMSNETRDGDRKVILRLPRNFK